MASTSSSRDRVGERGQLGAGEIRHRPGIISRPPSWPWLASGSRNTIWSGEDVGQSAWSSLSNATPDPGAGRTADGSPRWPDLRDVYGNGPSAAAASGCQRLLGPLGMSCRPPGTRWRPENWACARRCDRTDPCPGPRARVVHVEDGGDAVGHHEAESRSGRRPVPQRDDHHLEVTLGAADGVLRPESVVEERWKPRLLQFAAQVPAPGSPAAARRVPC